MGKKKRKVRKGKEEKGEDKNKGKRAGKRKLKKKEEKVSSASNFGVGVDGLEIWFGFFF